LIEEAHSHVNFMDLATNRAAYRLADQYDQEVLGYLSGYKQSALHENADTVNDQVNGTKAVETAGNDELLSSMKLRKGNFGNITTASAGNHSIPVAARLPGATSLPDAYVSPVMLINRMGRLLDQQNVDKQGRWIVIDPVMMEVTGTANQNTDYGVIVAGHDSAVATAEQINKTETYRDPDSFADIVRGMHLYGRKILRPEAIATAKYNLA